MEGIELSLTNKFKNTEAFIQGCENGFALQLDCVVEKILSVGLIKIITLAGPTCSGKTTAANMIIKRLCRAGKQTHLVSIDDFFFSKKTFITKELHSVEENDLLLRDFFIKYQDRIMFATDIYYEKSIGEDKKYIFENKGHIRFLNKLELPDDVLQKIAYKNAEMLYKRK